LAIIDISLNPNIIFQCNDFGRNTDLLLLKQKRDSDKFEIHIHNFYTNQAMAMVLEINDLGKMFDALQEYFQREQQQQQQIEI
jgi:hypothetical protein